MKLADDSHVFNIEILDAEFANAFDQTKPWIFETDDFQEAYATEEEACGAQRLYRAIHGFDPMTGLLHS